MSQTPKQLQIQEVIVTTKNHTGEGVNIAPMGVHLNGSQPILAPFKPSKTLDNLLHHRTASLNYTTDVRVFAGCLTGHYDWPLVATTKIDGMRLRDTLAHDEIEIIKVEEDATRPRCLARVVHREMHAPFRGMNRAQAAVLELAILVSRLHLLPAEKIRTEIEYLKIAITKTAGEHERTAWGWLMEKVNAAQTQTKQQT